MIALSATAVSVFTDKLGPLGHWLLAIAGAGIAIGATMLAVRAGWKLFLRMLADGGMSDGYDYGSDYDEGGRSAADLEWGGYADEHHGEDWI